MISVVILLFSFFSCARVETEQKRQKEVPFLARQLYDQAGGDS